MYDYKNNCYEGFKTREEAEDDYFNFVLKAKSIVGVGTMSVWMSSLCSFYFFAPPR